MEALALKVQALVFLAPEALVVDVSAVQVVESEVLGLPLAERAWAIRAVVWWPSVAPAVMRISSSLMLSVPSSMTADVTALAAVTTPLARHYEKNVRTPSARHCEEHVLNSLVLHYEGSATTPLIPRREESVAKVVVVRIAGGEFGVVADIGAGENLDSIRI